MTRVLQRLVNELPTIAVGVWAALRVAGIDLDGDTQAAILDTAETVGAAVLWMLVRARTDGPVTLLSSWSAERDIRRAAQPHHDPVPERRRRR